MMSKSRSFNNNYDFMIGYSATTSGVVFLKNKTTSLLEIFAMPASEKGGLINIKRLRLIDWEELATDYTFVDDTPCTHESK